MAKSIHVVAVAACVLTVFGYLYRQEKEKRRCDEANDEVDVDARELRRGVVRGESIAPPAEGIFRIVLTGGPCAGKTTALSRLTTFLRERGFRVYSVPEAATMLFTSGVTIADLAEPETTFEFQWNLVRTQMHLEDTLTRIAESTGQPSVIICDRGTMDGSAYMDREGEYGWKALVEKLGTTEIAIRDSRYNAVFHLVTAAIGAERFYSLANNETRSEPVEVAAVQDGKTKSVWIGHPNFVVVDNSTDFEQKMQRLVSCTAKLVGLPTPGAKSSTTKFLLRERPDVSQFPEAVAKVVKTFEAEKVYLRTATVNKNATPRSVSHRRLTRKEGGEGGGDGNSNGGGIEYVFVRSRARKGFHAYSQTVVRREGGQRIELKRILSRREFNNSVRMLADPSRNRVHQARMSFLWDDQSVCIHTYLQPEAVAGLSILHIQTEPGREVTLPPFLSVGEPIHDDGPYSAYQISLRENSSRPQSPASPTK